MGVGVLKLLVLLFAAVMTVTGMPNTGYRIVADASVLGTQDWNNVVHYFEHSGQFGKNVAAMMEGNKDRIFSMATKVLGYTPDGLLKMIPDIRNNIEKIMKGGVDVDMMETNFLSFCKNIASHLKKYGKAGEIVAKIIEMNRHRIGMMARKVISSGPDGLIRMGHGIRHVIEKILHGGLDMEVMVDRFNNLCSKIVSHLKNSSTVGKVVARVIEMNKLKLVGMARHLIGSGPHVLGRIIHDIRERLTHIRTRVMDVRDRIKMIVHGGLDMEKMQQRFNHLCEHMLNRLKNSCKIGRIVANIIERKRNMIIMMVRKVIASGPDGIIRMIHDIRHVIHKVMHMDMEMMERNIRGLHSIIVSHLKNSGPVGAVVARFIEMNKHKLSGMARHIISSGPRLLGKIIIGIRHRFMHIREGIRMVMHGGLNMEKMQQRFHHLCEHMLNRLKNSCKIGRIVAHIIERQRSMIIMMVRKVIASGPEGIIRTVRDIRHVINKVMHMHMEMMKSNLRDLHNIIVSHLKNSGLVGTVVARFIEMNKHRLAGMTRHLIVSVPRAVGRIINAIRHRFMDIRDGIRMVMHGGLNMEKMQQRFHHLCEHMLNRLRNSCAVGRIVANIIERKRNMVIMMAKKVIASGPVGIIRTVRDIRHVIGKVMHMDMGMMENNFRNVCMNMVQHLKDSGKLGRIVANIIERNRDRLVAIVRHVITSSPRVLSRITHCIREGIVTIMHRGLDMKMLENHFNSVYENVLSHLKHSGKIGTIAANVLKMNKYRLSMMAREMMASGPEGFIRMIHHTRDAIRYIIRMDEEIMERHFDALWDRITQYLNTHDGKKIAESMEANKHKVRMMAKKILSSTPSELMGMVGKHMHGRLDMGTVKDNFDNLSSSVQNMRATM